MEIEEWIVNQFIIIHKICEIQTLGNLRKEGLEELLKEVGQQILVEQIVLDAGGFHAFNIIF